MPGYSQSMSIPSNSPAAAPLPPAYGGHPPIGTGGKFPFRIRSMHDSTKARREAAVAATSEKYVESVKPPIDISTLRLGCWALSLTNWLKRSQLAKKAART